MNKRISAALCTMTALAAVMAVPTAAQAADPFPQGFTTHTENEAVVVYFGWEIAPKNLKVHLRKKGSATRVATLTRFSSVIDEDEICEPSCGDIIQYPQRGAVPKLAELGEYTVDVEYTGTLGESILRKDRATLNYHVRPVFQNLKASNGVSLAAPDTTVSGDIELYDPRTASSTPFTGPFTARTGTVTTPLTADAKGHFSSRITVSGAESGSDDDDADKTFVHLATTVNGVKDEEDVAVPVTAVEARIALDSDTVTGPYRTQGKVSGAVTWKTADGTWKPVPVKARISVGGGVGLTDDAGRFTVEKYFEKDDTWGVMGASAWLNTDDDIQSVTVDTTAGTHLSHFDASVNQFKNVQVRGWIDRVEMPAGTTSLQVDVQTSADGKTGWTTRKTVDVATQPGTNPSAMMETTLPYPGPGFVRMRYAGTEAIHGSETKSIKVQRTMTAIPEFNAAPEPVKKGQLIKVTGKLNHADPTWKPYAGQTINYFFKPAGSTGYKVMGTSKTATDGTFTRSFKADVTGTWYAWYAQPDANHFYAASRMDEVVVTP
ncbi:hypothetical protein OHA37_21285 [Streptomyces sp. NBC_00335]|uniref:hypothetical protein n=1 Tax=unclassified Streptomyces TaxID=2593676 RepID=UPI00225B98E4|nr:MULTISPECIES: hypothetical protein [unclassified Streptomyces]MCX5406396.1 hypothetical protein [Streptomyces sp. NBC_00086]